MKKQHLNDSGIALALVLIMVVILSVGMAAVSVLTQSASSALAANAKNSEIRTWIISDAIGKASQDISKTASINSPPDLRACSMFPKTYTAGPTPNGRSGQSVTVYCSESSESANFGVAASLVLTGTECVGACVIGVDGGIAFDGSNNSTCNDSDGHLELSGGIINSSGMWDNASCENLALSGTAKITQPLAGCSSGYGSSGNEITNCACPSVREERAYSAIRLDTSPLAKYSVNDCTIDNSETAFDDLDISNGGSTLKAYIDYTINGLGVPSGPATYNVLNNPGSPCEIQINEGIINANLWTEIDEAISGESSSKDCTLKMPLGTYLFKDVSFEPDSDTRIIAGNPTCSSPYDGSDTVQFQFSGTSYMKIAGGGYLSLCGKKDGVALVAISSEPFNSTVVGGKILIVDSAGNERAGSGLEVKQGSVIAPSGAADLRVNNSQRVTFANGAMFKAMTYSSTASITSNSSILPPPEFNGDRIVQFTLVGDEDGAQLGTVQFVVRDSFARRLNSGLSPIAWRTLW